MSLESKAAVVTGGGRGIRAGSATLAPLEGITLENWNRTMTVNATGPFLGTQTFLPGMLECGWGRVVNLVSIAGKVGHSYIVAHCASKHAIIGFTRALASEVAAKDVTVNAVCPGYIDTRMTDRSIANIVRKTKMSEQQAREHLQRTSPQNRLMDPEELAHLAVGLCHPGAEGVNGQAIVLERGAVQS